MTDPRSGERPPLPDPWAPPDPRGSGHRGQQPRPLQHAGYQPWPAAPAGTGAQPWPPQQPGPGQQPWPPQQTWPAQSPWPGSDPWRRRPDPRGRRRLLLAVGALAAVVLLLVGALAVAVVVEGRREARVREQVAALLPGLQAFVERERGLAFRSPVDVEVLDDDEFLDALYATPEGAPEPREDRDPEPTLQALGLLDEDADLDEEVGQQLDAGVVGFYEPVTDRLVVRGRDVDAFVEMVVVHELVHALQDQHFDIDRPELDEADDERATAFAALVEGDATLVEEAWYSAQSPRRQAEVDAYLAPPGSRDETVVEALLGFPYSAGPGYVEALLEDGGQAALDAAYADPPTTTEQVLHPGRHGARDVPRPDPGGEVLDEGVLGALGLALVLGEEPGSTDEDRWDGDRYVTYRAGERDCVVAHVAAPDPDELRRALTAWAATQPDASVDAGPAGTARLRACQG